MKKLLLIALVLMLVLALAACGNGAPAGGGGDVLVLRFSHEHAPTSLTGLQYQAFADAVYELSEGTMRVEIHPGGTIMPNAAALDGLMDGIVDIAHIMVSFVTGTIGDMAPLEVFGFYNNADAEWQYFLGEIRPVLEQIYAPFGIKYLGAGFQGEMVFLCTTRQILTPADMQGLTFRSAGIWYGRFTEAFGAAPTVIPPAELATAFERGTVQGTVVGWNMTVPLALFESAHYISETSYEAFFAHMAMSMDSWNRLTPEQQDIIARASRVYEEEAERIGRELIAQYRQTAIDNGNSVVVLTPEQQQAFIDLVVPLYDQMDLTEHGQELVDILTRIRGR